MNNKPISSKKYYVVSADVLPNSIMRVAEALHLLKCGDAKNASSAAKMANISRSVFYKYKDSIRPFYDKNIDRIITFYAMLNDHPGVLSSFLEVLAKAGANILTLNQNIPVNGLAPITISAQTSNLKVDVDTLVRKLAKTQGVVNVDIIAGE